MRRAGTGQDVIESSQETVVRGGGKPGEGSRPWGGDGIAAEEVRFCDWLKECPGKTTQVSWEV